jgi:hypothetical protein
VFVLFLFYRRGKFLSCQDVGPKLLRIAASEDETIKEDGEPDVAKSEEPLACLEPRSLAKAPIVRLLLDSTFARVRLDRKATSISLLVVLGVRADGQKVLLAIKSMGGESAEAWRTVLDDLIKRANFAAEQRREATSERPFPRAICRGISFRPRRLPVGCSPTGCGSVKSTKS